MTSANVVITKNKTNERMMEPQDKTNVDDEGKPIDITPVADHTKPTTDLGSAHLPSGSISLVELSELTKRLINSLSLQALSGSLPIADLNRQEAEKIVESSPNTSATSSAVQSPDSETFSQRLPKLDKKKPVKFTVRKVSRDTINTSAGTNNGQRQYSYGNTIDRLEPKEKKPLSKNEQLQRSQAKYDGYAVRVEKINKEIEFLSNLLPPYNVEIDYSTRNKIARAIEKLKTKQDEIQKKKYSLGITLSRLWREHDERELWVRAKSNQ
ncbi:hypothetical protein C7M61_001822 [Candidozyma pseudohaemuli]|uniref:Uncharacterized protein n=1 Tax=Candidozyma pseudohaemuli TaxID=418784 RepID=A0A2P7YTE1_9ASCO|nr:hypothetical protein C7M61_001822 [[Candida] pseudohaemulonii]PSK39219.1 hypothetical protein C7M61_001822 [[Candida] pseudohaemulonii]